MEKIKGSITTKATWPREKDRVDEAVSTKKGRNARSPVDATN